MAPWHPRSDESMNCDISMADELRAAPWQGGGAVGTSRGLAAIDLRRAAAQCVIDDSNGEGEGTLG